ncbi:P-loop NTPase domain-containing protein (plasmid) [Rhizobium phaseoli]|uniref:ATP-binding protein n=1 Tax=Rhizobium phaseoli TaxID=396 RepID=UPI0002FDC366|nr:ATP-binding protein [Rhizobium phaseoli]ANL31993.1 P-loop NTPase domain-containing protein [Rhizobium phaseoli]KKZ84198.1 ATPase AAA [Rhizobium phaseoli Ch24-10]RDJ04739.1 AAA family ATPase [Rhizobium phaseoli]RDJ06992.1 AAA family ATPase [Rhizobium phaseoli]
MALYPRLVEQRVADAMSDTRVVLVVGPRQSGKTTLAKKMANEEMEYYTLDNATTLDAARQDPVGFVRRIDRAIIDEIQRAPELLLAIKESADTDQRPGRFLLTGSANLMTLPRVADSLAGRMEVVRLLPLAQSEIRTAGSSSFLRDAFQNEAKGGEPIVGDDLMAAVLAGGYPEALSRKTLSRRQDWYADYIQAIVQRDVRDVAHIEQIAQMPRLLRILAEHSGQLVNYSGIGAAIGMNHITTQKYVGIFESLFLARTVQPWFSNKLKRLTKTPKIHFLDSGLLASLRDLSLDRLRDDRGQFGALLETFVFGEILKLASAAHTRFEFSHFRDKQQNEVDVVIEDRRGRIVGIEIKAAASVTNSDFSGLRILAEASRERFVSGIVLYDHDKVIPFGERLSAVPISALWR